jgi:peptidyl-prolyl cis-trans isomerase D
VGAYGTFAFGTRAMSKTLKQLLIAAAVVAIGMVFIIQFRPGTNLDKAGGPRCAVELSGDCIPHGDYVTAYRLAAPSLDAEVLKQLRMRKMIVDGLIERWLLVQDAKRLGITVSESDVKAYLSQKGLARFSLPVAYEDQFIMQMAYMQRGLVGTPYGPARFLDVRDPKTNAFDYKKYQRWVQKASGKTEKAFLEYQVEETLAARMRDIVRSRVRVSEAEAYAKYARSNEQLVVDYVKLERSYYRDYVLDTSDAAIDKWLGANQEEVDEKWKASKDKYMPECRQARHILVRVDDTKSDQEAEKKRVDAILAKAKKRIEDGEAFADVAKEVSEDQSTQKQGGELGCFAKGKLVRGAAGKKIDDAAFALEAGKVSAIIETDHGHHLVIVDKIAKDADAEKIGKINEARDLYLQKESERMAAEGSRQILAAVKDGKTLEQALQAHLDAVLPAAAKAAYERGKSGVKDAPKDKKEDKGEEKKDAKDGDAPKPEKKDADKDKKPPAPETKDAKDEKKDDAAEGEDEDEDEDADEDDEDAEEDAGYDAWTDPARPQVKTSDAFSRGAPPFTKVEKVADASRLLFELEKPGAVPSDVIKLLDGYAIAQLKERKGVDEKKWDEERYDFLASYRRQKQNDALIAYVQALKSRLAKDVVVAPALREGEGDKPEEAPPPPPDEG